MTSTPGPLRTDDLHARWDATTVDRLRAQGSKKWTAHPEALGMWLAEMDYGVADEILAALAPAVREGTLGYLAPPDRAALADATAAHLGEAYGWAVDPAHVVVQPDVMTSLSTTIEHLTEPGAPVVVPTPAYMPFRTWPGTHRRAGLEVPSAVDEAGRWSLDLDALDATLARTGPGALVLLCNPWNPVGRVLTRAELLAFADVIDSRGARVFSDEVHAPLVLTGTHVPYASLDARTAAHSVTAVSAAKGWNVPGLKCAQLILTDPTDRARLAPALVRLEDNVGLLGARAAVAAYRDGGPWIEAVREHLRGNVALLEAAVAEGHLPGGRLSPVEGTYIAWLDLRDTRFVTDGELDVAALREASGVALTDGALCGGAGHARLVFATPRPILTEAIERLGAALRD